MMFPAGQQSAHGGFSHLSSTGNAENSPMFLSMNPSQQRLHPSQQHGSSATSSPRAETHKKRPNNASSLMASNHHAMLNHHRDYREKQQRDQKSHHQMFQKANAQQQRASAFTNGHKQPNESPVQLNASPILLQQQQQQQQSAQNNLAAQLALQQLSAQLRQNTLGNYSVSQLQALLKQTGSPQLLRGQQLPASNSPDERRRPSLISNFPVHNHSPQMNISLIQQDNKLAYGLTAGLPIRSGGANLGIPQMMRSADIITPPAPNRAQHLLNNIHAAQPTSRVALDGVAKRERLEVRHRLDRATDDNKQLDAQAATINKRKVHLLSQMKSRQEEMEREQVEAAAAEAAAAQLRERAKAEASKRKIPLIDRIALENRVHVEETQVADRFFPSSAFTHSLAKITANYLRFAPALIRKMTAAKVDTQKRSESYLINYDEKYDAWQRRVEKFEKAPKKIAKDQRNRELFEKVFPEIKREREERERNERHERNNSEEPPPKPKEEKAIERACHIPTFSGVRPRHSFKNSNNEIDDQELANANDNISTFVGQWTDAEKKTFNERVRVHGKNFHVLSHFYWKKTCNDMVKYFYATKCEAKYKVHFPKAKKKVTKTYKPSPMPDFREMFEHLLESSPRPNVLAKVPCIICTNDVHVFSKIPEVVPEKEKLRKKLIREQEYRQKMSICAKCYSTYKKSALRCPVGKCPGGKRRFKPSRTLPTEFTDLPVEAQCLVVRTLQFHPGTPKVCNNCYKRIQTESVNIREEGVVLAPAYPRTTQSESKTQPKWTPERIDQLFNAIYECTGLPKHNDGEGLEHPNLVYDWEAIAARAALEDFVPTARQCRLVHAKLRDYWRVRDHRQNLEAAARHLRQLFRTSKRDGKLEIEENRVGQQPTIQLFDDFKMMVDVKPSPMDTSDFPSASNVQAATSIAPVSNVKIKYEEVDDEKENEKNLLSVPFCRPLLRPRSTGENPPHVVDAGGDRRQKSPSIPSTDLLSTRSRESSRQPSTSPNPHTETTDSGISTLREGSIGPPSDPLPPIQGEGSLTQGTPLPHDDVDVAVSSSSIGDPSVSTSFNNGNSLLSPLLANFVPNARSSTTASPNALSNNDQQGFSAANGSEMPQSIHKQLKDEQWAHYLLEELGLPRDSSNEDNVAQVSERLSMMSPHSFEELSNRLKLRTQQEQEANKLAKFEHVVTAFGDFKPDDELLNRTSNSMSDRPFGLPKQGTLEYPNELRSQVFAAAAIVSSQSQPGKLEGNGEKAKQFNMNPVLTTTTADIPLFDSKGDKFPSRRHTNAVAERPNRKSGIANMVLESASPTDRTASPMHRGRAQTMQKHHYSQNRPASVPGSTEAITPHPIKMEPIDPTYAHPLSNVKGKVKTGRAPSNNSHRLLYRRPACDGNGGAGAGGGGDGPPNENPAYESLSDDSSSASSSDSEKPPEPDPSSDQQPPRPRFRRLFTPLTLPHHERIRIPPCQKPFQMPPIEARSDPPAPAYEDLSD